MNATWRQTLILARRTLSEIIRARVLYAILVFILLILWGSTFVGSLTFESSAEVAVDLGLTGAFAFSALIAILLGHAYVGDAAGPIFHPLLGGGIGRGTLFLGRWLGASVAGLGIAILPLLFLPAFIGMLYELAPENVAALRAAAVYYPLEALLLITWTGALSVMFRRPVALSFAFGLWLGCHLHPDTLAYEILYPAYIGKPLAFIVNLTPNLENFNPLLVSHFGLAQIGPPLLQTLVYTGIGLLFGALYFRQRDL